MSYAIRPSEATETTASTFAILVGAGLVTQFRQARPTPGMPGSIPADQRYYWSMRWQENEARARADLAAGRYRTFDDPAAAVRHLLSGDR